MKQLPKFAFLDSLDLEGKKIICLKPPYFIADVRTLKRDDKYVSHFLEDLANERFPMAKVKGYTIFLRMYSSLEPNNSYAEQQDMLNEMAEWFYKERVLVKTGTYMKSEETGILEEKILMKGRMICERKKNQRNG